MKLPAIILACLLAGCVRGEPARAEPPPEGLARDALARRDLEWITRRAPGLRIHFLAGTHPARAMDQLTRAVREARAHDLERLGVARFDHPIDVFFVESRPQIEALVGMRCTGLGVPEAYAVFLMENADWRSFERHELMHVLAHRMWGTPAEPSGWIDEGWAQAADGACGCCGVDTVFAAMAREKGVIPLPKLVQSFRELPDLDAYLEATSLVEFLRARWGVAAVRAIWQGGPDVVPRVTGLEWPGLERAWRATLPASPGIAPGALAKIRAKGCG